MNSGISMVLLAYKEEENIRSLLPDIIEKLGNLNEPYEIIVVDTEASLDRTKDVCQLYGATYINQELPGFGGAFCTAIKYASMDKFLIMDSDGSHPPKYIPRLYEKFEGGNYDIVIGSRYINGGITHDKLSSRMMSLILNFVFRLAIGIDVKDCSTDYRIYRTADLKNTKLSCRNYDVLQEVLLDLKLQKKPEKIKIGEVPIEFRKRSYGESKRRLILFIISYIKTLVTIVFVRLSNYFKYN